MGFRLKLDFAAWRATAETPKPDVSFVPPLERRRLTGVERAALGVAWRVRPADEVPVRKSVLYQLWERFMRVTPLSSSVV